MIAYLTSSPGGFVKENGKRTATGLDQSNRFIEKIKSDWKENARCLMISADPEAAAMNDGMKALFHQSLLISGLSVGEFVICDNRNRCEADRLTDYDVVILSGGHVPTQNSFFQSIMLKKKIGMFDGLVIGISAGTMNCAETVYAQPELEGESIDPGYQRFIKGLGITDIMILPHYQNVKDSFLDGKRLMEDITYPDSRGRRFLALIDGSYVLIKNGVRTLYGEGYWIEDGKISEACVDGKWIGI